MSEYADWLRLYADSRIARESALTVASLRECARIIDELKARIEESCGCV